MDAQEAINSVLAVIKYDDSIMDNELIEAVAFLQGLADRALKAEETLVFTQDRAHNAEQVLADAAPLLESAMLAEGTFYHSESFGSPSAKILNEAFIYRNKKESSRPGPFGRL